MMELANPDLQVFHKWCGANRLTEDLNKACHMIFANRSRETSPSLKYNFYVIKSKNITDY